MISVLIPDVDEWLSLPVIHCLKVSRKVDVHGLARRSWKPVQYSLLFSSFEYLNTFELESWLKRIDAIAVEQQVDIIMPVSSTGIRALSEHGRELSSVAKLVLLPEVSTFEMATNKAALAEFLAVNALPQPRTVPAFAGMAPFEGLAALRFPVLAKPPLLSGGAGIRRLENLDELEHFLASQHKDDSWVVQEFIEGTDLSVNVLCENGQIIASTIQHAIAPLSVPYGPVTGVQFRFDARAMEIATSLVEKLGWSGVACIDMRFDARRRVPLILEVNGRYWQSLLGSLHAGVNFPLLACEAVLGRCAANRQVREVRYFSGWSNAALSLFGGGRNHIVKGETDLAYLLDNAIFFALIMITKLVLRVGRKFGATGGNQNA